MPTNGTILHTDYRRTISTRPGKGRFLVAEDEHLLTIFLHLPSISEAPESEVSRQQTLMRIAKNVRRRLPNKTCSYKETGMWIGCLPTNATRMLKKAAKKSTQKKGYD